MCLEAASIAELRSEQAASCSISMSRLFAISDASGLEVTTMTFDGKVADATIFNTSISMDLASAARSDGSRMPDRRCFARPKVLTGTTIGKLIIWRLPDAMRNSWQASRRHRRYRGQAGFYVRLSS